MDLEKCFTVHLADLVDLYWIIFDRGFFSVDEIIVFSISYCSFCLKLWDTYIFIYCAIWSNLLCTQHMSQVLFNLHPGTLLFLLCITIVQSASIRYAKLVRSPFRQFCGVPQLYTELLQKIWGGTMRKKMVSFSHSSVLTGDVLGF